MYGEVREILTRPSLRLGHPLHQWRGTTHLRFREHGKSGEVH